MAGDVNRWRDIADLDARAGAPVGNALREAADEVERLRSVLDRAIQGREMARIERNALKAAHDGLLSSIALYIKWRYVTRQLTTKQKDLFADALERESIRVHGPDGEDPEPDMARLPSYAPRWWRDDQPADTTGDTP